MPIEFRDCSGTRLYLEVHRVDDGKSEQIAYICADYLRRPVICIDWPLAIETVEEILRQFRARQKGDEGGGTRVEGQRQKGDEGGGTRVEGQQVSDPRSSASSAANSSPLFDDQERRPSSP